MAPPNATWNGKDSQGNPLRWGMPGLTWNGQVPQSPTPPRMPHLHVSLAFMKATDQGVGVTAGHVSAQLYGNAAYPSPPVTQVALNAANAALTAAIVAQSTGGKAATADKNNKRENLLGLLRQLAAYVETMHHDDLAVLLSSGFEAVRTGHAPAVIGTPNIRDVHSTATTQALIRADVMANVRTWKARFAAIGAGGVPGPWQDGGTHGDSQHILVINLTPGTNYAFEIQAVFGGETTSAWSNAVNCMSM